MLTAIDLAYFDDILTLIQLGHVCLQFYKFFSCSGTKLLSFYRQKSASSSSIPFSDIYKNHRGRKNNILIRLRLVLLMNLKLNNFQQKLYAFKLHS